jgi:hypothetical protein
MDVRGGEGSYKFMVGVKVVIQGGWVEVEMGYIQMF